MAAGDPQAAWYAIKGILTLVELLGVFLLARLVPPAALALYAWHPLAIVEVAGQGHTEGGMVGMVVLAGWAYRRGRGEGVGAALAVGGGFKLIPFLFLPFALGRQRGRVLGAAAVVGVALALPYAAPYVIPNVRASLDLYVRLFEWNAGPYLLLKEAARWVTGEDLGKAIGPALQGVFLVGLPVLWWVHRQRRWRPEVGWLLVSGWFLATATTVHPWYVLGVLALVPLAGVGTAARRWHAGAWHALAAGALATYGYYGGWVAWYWGSVIASWTLWGMALLVTAGFLLLPSLMRQRARRKWAWLRPHAGSSGRLLDLGAGEGYVGACAAREGFSVELADVADFNQTALPLTFFDGRRLPFEENVFDATVLAYVLHHASDPEALLAEAHRVTRGRVLVLESVVETSWDRLWLPRADRLANRVRSGGRMPERVRFRSAAGWRAAFEGAGFCVVAEEARGGPLHRKRLFVLVPLPLTAGGGAPGPAGERPA